MRTLFAACIALLPFNAVHVALYRLPCGYDIDRSSRVAAGTLLVAREVVLRQACIGPLNLLRLDSLQLEAGAFIGKLNMVSQVRRLMLREGACVLHRNFIGGTHGTDVACGREDLELGPMSQLSLGCFIDLSDRITLGRDVVVAGARTQFWTHGFDHRRQRSTGQIAIADRVFIGSASVVVQDVQVCSDVVVAAGSVVHRSITEPGLYASGQLRRIR